MSEANYRTTDTCDTCKTHGEGTMMHAADASGVLTPVLFQCDACRPNATEFVWPESDDTYADLDEPVDDDHASALALCEWCTDEDYGLFDASDYGPF